MASTRPDTVAIDAALAKGEWWLRLFDELSNCGRRRSEALRNGKSRWPTFGDLTRIAQAVSLAIVAAIRLRGHLKNLARLRALAPAEAKAQEGAATRQAALDTAKPNPTPQPIILAPWEPAPPIVLTPVHRDPPGRTPRATDIALAFAHSTTPNARPWLPPRPG